MLQLQRTIQSFVRRTSRITASQEGALRLYSSKFNVTTTHLVSLLDWVCHSNVVLEIGFGNGTSLLQMAKEEPSARFLGVEVHTPGVGRLLGGLKNDSVDNVRVFQDDVMHLLDANVLPKHCFSRVQIYFPDPWGKKRHRKRRLVQVGFIALLLQYLKPEGLLHIVSDHADYFKHIKRTLSEFSSLHAYSGGRIEWVRPTTAFEKKAIAKNHVIQETLLIHKIEA